MLAHKNPSGIAVSTPSFPRRVPRTCGSPSPSAESSPRCVGSSTSFWATRTSVSVVTELSRKPQLVTLALLEQLLLSCPQSLVGSLVSAFGTELAFSHELLSASFLCVVPRLLVSPGDVSLLKYSPRVLGRFGGGGETLAAASDSSLSGIGSASWRQGRLLPELWSLPTGEVPFCGVSGANVLVACSTSCESSITHSNALL